MKKGILITLLTLLGISIFVWALLPNAIPAEVATISHTKFQQVVEEDGKTRPKNVFEITSPVSGNLLRVNHKAGEQVEKGQVLARIVPSTSHLLDMRDQLQLQEAMNSANAALLKSKAQRDSAKSAYETAILDLKRKNNLAKHGYVSKSELEHQQLELDLRKKDFESAQHSVDVSQHEFLRAKFAHENFTTATLEKHENNSLNIRSPINGQIIKLVRESAGAIERGTPILEVADVQDIEIVVDILSTDAVNIPVNADVIINSWGKQEPLHGKVRLIEPGGFTKISALGVEEQRVNVIIDITSPKEQWQKLGSGFQIDAQIIVLTLENQLTVPVSALFRDGNEWAVFKVKNNRANLQRIKIKMRNTKSAIIDSGLKESDKVIIYPGDRVKDGVRISTQN